MTDLPRIPDGGPITRWLAHGAGAVREVARAIVPVVCPGCGLPDVRWCEACAALWWEEPWRAEDSAGRLAVAGRPPLPVWTVCSLAGPAHLMIVAWKDGGRRDLDPFFEAAARRAAVRLGSALRVAEAVVAIPPHRRSLRARGTDLTSALASAVAAGLAEARSHPAGNAGVPVTVARLLVNRGQESRGRGDRARWTNALRGLHAVDPPSRPSTVVLVDDVMTTGASVARACDVLEGLGIAVVGAVTLATTPARAPGTSVP